MRNWDHRFTWLRDSPWVVSALMDLGDHDESMAFISWLESLGLAPRTPSVVYAVDGSPLIDEQELGHLRGYRGRDRSRSAMRRRGRISMPPTGGSVPQRDASVSSTKWASAESNDANGGSYMMRVQWRCQDP